MPNIPVRIGLTKEQWKVFLERILQRRGLTQRAAGAIMDRPFEPPVTREVGTLYRDVPIGAGEIIRRVERLPIEEARAKYLAAPEQYVSPRTWSPEARVLRVVEPGSPEELAAGIAYERVKEVPLLPPIPKSAKVMQRDIEAQELESAVSRLGIRPEDVRPGVSLKTVIEEAGRKPKDMITVPPAQELAALAEIADQIWKDMGGSRSSGGKAWELLRMTQRRPEPHIRSARDYFISCFLRWKQAPRKFTNTHPKEARLLEQLWREFEESLKPQPTAIPGTIPPGGRAGGGVAVGGVE